MASEYMYWDELRGQPINIAGQGRQIGHVEDFYYEPDAASIKGLRVNAGLSGSRILVTSAIAALGRDGVTIANENMLIDETNAGDHSHLPLGSLLRGLSVITQDRDLGAVGRLLLGISPLVALRLAAIELEGSHTRIAAHAIARFGINDLRLLE